MGLKLRNPIIAGSSGLTSTLDNIIKLQESGIGAVVLKSLFEEQINHAISKTMSHDENVNAYPEALDYISHYTREQDLERYLSLIRDAKAAVDIPIIASINCVSSSEWVTFARQIQDAGADALELNIFILPSDTRRKSDQTEQIYFEIIQSVLKQVSIPVAVKISYFFSGFAHMALQLSWTGISGLVMFNRFFSPDIDIDNYEITATNVFSQPSEIANSLRWVAMLSKRVQCDIAASTGIHDGSAVIKQLLAGAKAVQIASVLYKEGFGKVGEMLDEIDQWMVKQDFSSVSEFTGMLSFREDKSMAAYERVQFMKHFAGIE
jgi:dihydroorotate dehydrogenase (fumarate)